eukprot:scaffold6671_cov286-Chaetoceros_neogracile.AAC.16
MAIFTCLPSSLVLVSSLLVHNAICVPKLEGDPSPCRRGFLVNTLSGIVHNGSAIIVAAAFTCTADAADNDKDCVYDNDVAEGSMSMITVRTGTRMDTKTGFKMSLLSIESAARANTLGEIPMRLYPDPILRRIASPVKKFGPDLQKVADLLVAGMKSDATAASQYGIDARMIVLKGSANPASSSSSSNQKSSPPLILINPNILTRSSEYSMVQWREYCLVMDMNMDMKPNASAMPTHRHLEINLLRDEIVEVAAQDVTGRPVRKALSGEPARAFLHELDHINGILIVDHADLIELPADVAALEAPYHEERQRRAFDRDTYQGNTPLYW